MSKSTHPMSKSTHPMSKSTRPTPKSTHSTTKPVHLTSNSAHSASRSTRSTSKSPLSFLASFRQILLSSTFLSSIALLCAFIGAIGALQLLKFLTPNTAALTNNLLLCALVFLLYLYYKPFIHHTQSIKTDHRSFIFALIVALIFSTIFIIGGQLEFYDCILWSVRTLVKIFCVFFLLFPLSNLVLQKLLQLRPGKFTLQPRKHALIAFFCLLGVTLLVWLIIFPGIYTYDMASQNEILSKGSATGDWYSGPWSVAHWSLSYGFLLAGFLDFGHLIFHNYEAGLALAMLVQALFICFVETRIILFATKLSQSRKVYLLSIFFFCFMPFLVVLSVSAAQDVLFAGLFTLIVLNLFELIFDTSYFSHRLNFFKLPLLSFFMCTVRSNGVYCLLFLLIFTLLFYRRPKRHLVIMLIIPIFAAFIYNGPFIKMLHIEKATSVQEMLSVPSQQLARAYYRTTDGLTPEELSTLAHYYDLEGGEFELYQKYPLIADHTKGALKISATQSGLGDYIGLWLTVGLKHPKAYIEAFLLNSFGYWYPNKNYNDPRFNLDFINYPGFAMTSAFMNTASHPRMKPVERHSLISDKIAGQLDALVFGNGWLKIPFYATFCAMGTYILLLLFVIGYLCLKRQYHLLMPLSFVFGLFLTLLLSPVAIFRYAYPIVMLAPCFTSLFYLANQNPKANQSLKTNQTSKSGQTLKTSHALKASQTSKAS